MRILIVYINENDQLRECLSRLKQYSPEVKVDLIKADKEKTKIAEEEINEYLKTAKDDTLIWHPDMLATPGWYEQYKEFYNLFDIIGLKLLYPNGLIQHYGGFIRVDGGGIHGHQYCLNIGLDLARDCAYVTGAGLLVKKEVYKKIGGFDTTFDYFVDVDWCLRAKQHGLKVGVVPVEVIHLEAQDKEKEGLREQWLKAKERFIKKWKNYLTT